MSKVRVKLNSKGVQELLKGEAMQGVLTNNAKDIAARCGNGFIHYTRGYKKRAVAIVYAKSYKARQRAYKENVLLKALR